MNKKILRNLIVSSLAVGVINFSPIILHENNLQIVSVAYAKVENVTASDSAILDFGEENPQFIETVKNIAKMRAVQAAKEKAGVYVKSFSKTVNGILTDDDISAYTSNNITIVDVQYKKILVQAHDVRGNDTGKIAFMYEATVTAKVDTSDLQNYIRRDEKEKSTIVQQNNDSKKNVEKISNDYENLRNNAENKNAEQIKSEVEKIDNEVLAQQKFDEGNRLYYLQKYSQSIALFEESLKIIENNKEALYMLGEIYFSHLTNRNKALTYYKKVVEIDPYYVNAWKMMSIIYKYDLHNEEKYLECFNKVVENGNKMLNKNPNDIKILFTLGETYEHKDDKKALEYYTKAVEVAPNEKETWLYLGRFHLLISKDYNKAIDCNNKALSIDPNYLYAWNNLGVIYTFLLKNYDKAIECYNKTLQIDPNYYKAYNNLGNVYSTMKNYDKAIEYYDKAVKFAPENKDFFDRLADTYKKLKNYKKAIECYEKALKIAPKDNFLWTRLAWLYSHEMKNYQKAVECYTKAIEINPKDATSYRLRGFCYKSLGNNEQAQADFAKAKELGYEE